MFQPDPHATTLTVKMSKKMTYQDGRREETETSVVEKLTAIPNYQKLFPIPTDPVFEGPPISYIYIYISMY